MAIISDAGGLALHELDVPQHLRGREAVEAKIERRFLNVVGTHLHRHHGFEIRAPARGVGLAEVPNVLDLVNLNGSLKRQAGLRRRG